MSTNKKYATTREMYVHQTIPATQYLIKFFFMFAGLMLNHVKIGSKLRSYAFQFPQVTLASTIQPITRNVLRVHLNITPDFQWNDKMHGGVAEPWWIWVEDPDTNNIYHSEFFLLTRKAVSMPMLQIM